MSGGTAQSSTAIPAENSADPSMEDILASIRRILADDEAPPAAPEPEGPEAAAPYGNAADNDDDVLVLDQSMMIPTAPPPRPAMAPKPAPRAIEAQPPPPAPPISAPPISAPPISAGPISVGLIGSETETAAAASVSQLVRSLSAERQLTAYRGGPTLEDMVLDAMRPMLKAWLDQNLPPMVERLVRIEIERVTARALR